MGIFPHSDRLISSKGGGIISKVGAIACRRGTFVSNFQESHRGNSCSLCTYFSNLSRRRHALAFMRGKEASFPPSQRPSIFSHWSNGMPMQVSSKQFLIFLFRLPDGAFLLREIVRIKT